MGQAASRGLEQSGKTVDHDPAARGPWGDDNRDIEVGVTDDRGEAVVVEVATCTEPRSHVACHDHLESPLHDLRLVDIEHVERLQAKVNDALSTLSGRNLSASCTSGHWCVHIALPIELRPHFEQSRSVSLVPTVFSVAFTLTAVSEVTDWGK